MAVNVKLPEALVETAKRYGALEHRSVPKQIEYWSQIGKIVTEILICRLALSVTS